jgi:aminoglycoside phosphotransferase (APT) family kinase protein
MKMHDGEADIDAGLVAKLVAAQFPDLAGLPVTPFRSTGTVNAIYRLGNHLYARLPRVARWARDLETESHWLPRLAPGMSLRIPERVAMGQPGDGYPWSWAIYRWIDGQPYADELVADERQAACALAGFVTGLRRMDAGGAPGAGRRPLRELDAAARAAIESAGYDIDRDAVLAAWELALKAPAWDGRMPTWIHADLLRPNLLVDGGDGAWARARGIALHQAVMLIPYYRETNPGMAALGRRTVGQVLADLRARGGDAAGPGPSARSRW